MREDLGVRSVVRVRRGLPSLRSKRLSNIGRAVIGSAVLWNAAARSVKLAQLFVFPYFYTARPKLHKRLLRRLRLAPPGGER